MAIGQVSHLAQITARAGLLRAGTGRSGCAPKIYELKRTQLPCFPSGQSCSSPAGTVAGYTVNAVTGEGDDPVVGALALLCDPVQKYCYTLFTDSNGAAEFENIKVGTYDISVAKVGVGSNIALGELIDSPSSIELSLDALPFAVYSCGEVGEPCNGEILWNRPLPEDGAPPDRSTDPWTTVVE